MWGGDAVDVEGLDLTSGANTDGEVVWS